MPGSCGGQEVRVKAERKKRKIAETNCAASKQHCLDRVTATGEGKVPMLMPIEQGLVAFAVLSSGQ